MEENIEIIELNEEKAKQWYAEKENLSFDDVVDYPFFDSLNSIFEWVYLDENDSHQDTINTAKYLASIDVNEVVKSGANTIAEYLALSWERTTLTPYGYLVVEL